jgi:hypothetical protein
MFGGKPVFSLFSRVMPPEGLKNTVFQCYDAEKALLKICGVFLETPKMLPLDP